MGAELLFAPDDAVGDRGSDAVLGQLVHLQQGRVMITHDKLAIQRLQAIQHSHRFRANGGQVTQTDQAVGLLPFDVGQHCLQRCQVAMNIGKERNSHECLVRSPG